jgi:hypothetical protein
LGSLALVVLAAAGYGVWIVRNESGKAFEELRFHSVRRENLQPIIVERGALESAENAEIVCRVKSRTPGSTIVSTVRWLIDAGTEVRKGDKLIELDDSGLEELLSTQQITVDTARATWIQAEEAYKIGDSQNASDIASAKLKLEQARIALRNYLEGTYEKTRTDILGRMEMAKSDLEMWRERAEWSEQMSAPARRVVTQAQAEADAARRASADIVVKRIQEELRVLDDPQFGTKAQTQKQLQGDIDEAIRALDRTIKQANAKEVQLDSDRQAKRAIYEQGVKAAEDITAEIKKCVLTAPNPGLVVYYVPAQARMGMGTLQSIVAQGEPVREGQKLLRIPNLKKMVVITKIHEALVSKVRGDQWQRTGFSDCLQISLWTTPDLFGRLFGQLAFADQRSAFAETHTALEKRLASRGQRAQVRVDAFPDRPLKSHVQQVASVASGQDMFTPDVKVYETVVAIDEPLEGLRPDMSAEVTVFMDDHAEAVLAIPVQALIGWREGEGTAKCFVMEATGPAERVIRVGMSNDLLVEAKSGLEEGERVVVNPRALLPELGNPSAAKRRTSGEPGTPHKAEQNAIERGNDPGRKNRMNLPDRGQAPVWKKGREPNVGPPPKTTPD